MTTEVKDLTARAILRRITALGYQVSVRRQPDRDGWSGLEVRASDARTGEDHVVRPASPEWGELECTSRLAALVADELEG